MCEILAVILQLHARYEKLILKEPKNRSRQHVTVHAVLGRSDWVWVVGVLV